MAVGPGKYDDAAVTAREQTDAEGVVLIVLGGRLGSGFSVVAEERTALALPDLLEQVARQIRLDIATMGRPQ